MKITKVIILLLLIIISISCTKDDPVSSEQYRTIQINAKNYLRDKYFFVDQSFESNWNTPENYARRLEHTNLLPPEYQIKPYSFELYVTKLIIGVQPKANIYIDYLSLGFADSIQNYPNLYKENMNVVFVPDSLYSIDYDLGYIRLDSLNLNGGQILAAKYTKRNISNPDQLIVIGNKVSDTEYALQLLGEQDQHWDDPWSNLEWRNVYSLGRNNIGWELDLIISKNTPEGVQYSEYDRFNDLKSYLYWHEVSDPENDNEINIHYIKSGYGEFHFPNCRPFMPDSNSIIYSETMQNSSHLLIDEFIYQDPPLSYESEFMLEFKIPDE